MPSDDRSATSSSPSLCVAMIVRHAEYLVAQTLDSVRPIADSIVVLDTGSADGTVRPARHDMPRIQYLLPGQRATGWIAVSLYHLKTNAGYQWLEEFAPVTTVGRSIRLYYVDPGEAGSGGRPSNGGS